MAVIITQNTSISQAPKLSEDNSVWDFSQVLKMQVLVRMQLLEVMNIDANFQIGRNCKVRNRDLVYNPAIVHDAEFIGPSAILTNDKNLRLVSTSCDIKEIADWDKVGDHILEGAALGSGVN